MASCYLCAAHIPPGQRYRREVMTSQSSRVYFSKRGGGSYGQTHALRTLCSSCAAELDRRREGQRTRIIISLGVAFIGCIAAIRMRDSVTGGLSSLIYAFFLFGGAGLIVFTVMQLAHSKRVREEEAGSMAGYSEPQSEQQVTGFESKALESDQVNDGEPYPGIAQAVKGIHERLKEIGISLMGCYGFSESNEGARNTITLLLRMQPVQHYSGLNKWEEAIFQQTLSRFGKEIALHYENAKKAQKGGSDDDFIEAFKPVFKLFPMNGDEDFKPYLDRMGAALSRVSELINAEG